MGAAEERERVWEVIDDGDSCLVFESVAPFSFFDLLFTVTCLRLHACVFFFLFFLCFFCFVSSLLSFLPLKMVFLQNLLSISPVLSPIFYLYISISITSSPSLLPGTHSLSYFLCHATATPGDLHPIHATPRHLLPYAMPRRTLNPY